MWKDDETDEQMLELYPDSDVEDKVEQINRCFLAGTELVASRIKPQGIHLEYKFLGRIIYVIPCGTNGFESLDAAKQAVKELDDLYDYSTETEYDDGAMNPERISIVAE